MGHTKIVVSADVMEGLEAVRLSGQTNMIATSAVIQLARAMGFSKAASWVSDNRNLYVWGVLLGFQVNSAVKKEGDDEECVNK
jgi:hypothetical protein